MSPDALAILADLQAVDRLRHELALDVRLQRRTLALKDYQARRFARTYSDLLAVGSVFRDAALFFLEELYAAKPFDRRDAQFARIVPSAARIFSHEVLATLATLAQLHSMTEQLDVAMARLLPDAEISRSRYAAAWQRCGRYEDRQRQLSMTLEIGRALQRHTRSSSVRHLLRLMRAPAKAAGLGELQHFLERGFATFGQLTDSTGFLQTIEERERSIIIALSGAAFDADTNTGSGCIKENDPPLDQFP